MDKENQFVDYFYDRYQGRVAIGVGFGQDLKEIFPFVFIDAEGNAIGIAALGIVEDPKRFVYIYHLGAFTPRLGNGSLILKEICHQADIFNISLSVAAISMKNGKDPRMDTECLVEWYGRFGFKGAAGLLRKPATVSM